MKISITLVHNKTDSENTAQIEALKPLLKTIEDGPFTNPDTGETWTTFHQEFIGLNTPHEVRVYQVVPFGVTPPVNRGEIQSGGIVYYGEGDEDKTGNHPRFFNWGLKRGTDNGADVSIYLEDVSKFDLKKLEKKLTKLMDRNDTTEYAEDTYGKMGTVKLLKEVGQLKEDRNLSQAVAEFKQRVTQKGLKVG